MRILKNFLSCKTALRISFLLTYKLRNLYMELLRKEASAKQEPQRTPAHKFFDCLDKHFAEDGGTMREIGLAKPENPDEVEMWYNDDFLYVYKKHLRIFWCSITWFLIYLTR